ncbi:MAG TPA: ATP-binding protein [Dissulfurispiraceae bacterium]|nr:ATP-binding protein [Dissulfurispiraceae bacterium]
MIFPFTALVNQEEMKTALILNVIDPSIGGLLIMGEKGTGKSTAVRALAELLPELEAVKDCPFTCDAEATLCSDCRDMLAQQGHLHREARKMRMVELPLGVTEDRLVGTLDIEHAIRHGEKRFEAGILAEANRNFLYVDEVNLLEDHIVDLMLDSAAMGVNTVEREGISFVHPARFILVGTMNPEEGDLRPQLLDRFGLCVSVTSLRDKKQRVEILKRKAAFDAAADIFYAAWSEEQEKLAAKIVAARRLIASVPVDDAVLEKIVTITSALSLDGHRADIVMMKAARAMAAYRGLTAIGSEEIKDASWLALRHRLKRLPFEDAGAERDKVTAALAQV